MVEKNSLIENRPSFPAIIYCKGEIWYDVLSAMESDVSMGTIFHGACKCSNYNTIFVGTDNFHQFWLQLW